MLPNKKKCKLAFDGNKKKPPIQYQLERKIVESQYFNVNIYSNFTLGLFFVPT
jgi:hypothetical protein